MLLQQVDDRPHFERPWMNEYRFHLVDSIEKLKKLVDVCIQRRLYSIDLESTGVDTRVYPDEYFDDGIKTRHGMRTVDRIVGVCMSFDGLNGYYIPLSHEPEGSNNLPWDPAWDELERLVHSGARAILHNAKFDCELLFPVTKKEYWEKDEYEDTFLMAKVVNPLKGVPSGLKQLTKMHFGVDMIELSDLFTPEMVAQLKREKRSTHNFAVLHPKEGLVYGCSDGIFTYKLFHALQEKVSDGDKIIYNLEKSFCNVLRKLERNRVHVDKNRVMELARECDEALLSVGDIIRGIIESHTGSTKKWLTLNVGSPKQLSSALITDPEGLRLKPTQLMLGENNENTSSSEDDDDSDSESSGSVGTAIKQYTLKDEALKSLHDVYGKKYSVQRPGHLDKNGNPKSESIFELIIEWRHYLKMKGSYIEPLSLAVDKYGDVRPDFRQMGTDTARLASRAGEIEQGYSGINFQGIPRDSDDDKPELFKQIRTCIIPRPGFVLVKLDFAGEELRVVTNLSGDPIWTDSFLNKDGDVHSITAKTLFGKEVVSKDERNRGKRCNFAFIYGGGAGAIQRNIGCTMDEAQRHMENLKRDVPVLMGYVEHQKNFAKKNKCIYTAYGRRIPIENIDSPIRALRSKAERCAINYTIQSTSADILKFAMCLVDKKIRQSGWEEKVKYVLTVHDEVVYEIKPELLMEAVRKLDEWMTTPWKLPKAHGRDWVVPLLTEPGIDINWKARWNFFEMVDGVPAEPKQLDESGKFIGKLKKDQYFLNGRVYQKIPDFLEKWIWRADSSPPAPSASTELSVSSGPSQVSIRDAISELTLDTSPDSSVDIKLNSNYKKESVSDEKVPQEPKAELKSENLPDKEVSSAKSDAVVSEPEKCSPIEIKTVHRFTIRAVLSKNSMKKLQAICILAEGDTLLRVVSPSGKVLVNESEGIQINPTKFDVLSDMFGLG
jgi:DNA polymerase I-like protein with 3'-5' exonuclease and polymerase domains